MLRKSATATRPVRGKPFTRFVGDLNRKKIILVTTAGIAPRLQGFSEPEEGFYVYPTTVQIDDLYLPHRHFGIEEVESDLNCLFPIDRLRELAGSGVIQAPTEEHLSVYGFHLIKGHVRKVLAPRLAELVEAADAGAAIILGGCLFCHRIAGVVQKAIEDRGIPTVIISQYPLLSQYYGAARIFAPVGFQPGHAVGPPNYPDLQRQVLRDAIEILPVVNEPLTLVEKVYPEYPVQWLQRRLRRRKGLRND